MARLAQTAGLTDIQQEILGDRPDFVDKEILPHATALEHADEYPQEIVDGMKEMGLFGLTIPEEYGGLGESLLTYALVVEQIARGWMSVSGIINTHFIVAYMLKQHGTEEQKAALPAADGDGRDARGVLDVGAGAGLGRGGDQDQGRAGRRRVRPRRREDVADQRRHVEPGRGAGAHRRGRREALPEHDLLPRGEARGFGEVAPGLHRPRARSTRWATRASTPPRWCSRATACPPSRCWAASAAAVSPR